MTQRKHARGMRNTQQKGQTIVEYTICALILILALFAPFNYGGVNASAVDRLTNAIKENHRAKVATIGSPVVGSSVQGYVPD